MIKEGNPLASRYKEKSIAEQNSVDLCWNLLMQAKYKDLRKAIYANDEELQRFRQLVVNVVMGKFGLPQVALVYPMCEIVCRCGLTECANFDSNGYCGQRTSSPS